MKTIDKLISFFSGTIVEKRPSPISGELEVWRQNGKYVLHSPDANYSFDTLHRVFQKAFKNLEIKKRNPESVLILGFGAGSVATILCDELKLNSSITGVELDPEVIALAKKYFHLDRFENLELHVADAAEFVQTCNRKFDLVVSDVFVDKNVPDKFFNEDYIRHLLRATSKKGLGVMNIIAETNTQKQRLKASSEWFTRQQASVSLLKVSDINVMVIWGR